MAILAPRPKPLMPPAEIKPARHHHDDEPISRTAPDAESQRLEADEHRNANWKRWGPYLSERQWGTVREDYSESGDCWNYFPHDQARSRAYRWGEDGILGITDRQCRLCFALTLWNEKDPILKERLFGLTGPEGNHGEDVKEHYFYLDSTPTHSYMRGLYKYPQAEFPYARLVDESRRRSRSEAEFELADSGVFNDSRYFDAEVEYAKASPEDIAIRITIHNRGPEPARLHALPTLWFRNHWSWGCTHEGCEPKPTLWSDRHGIIEADHTSLGKRSLFVGLAPDGSAPELLFCENQTNTQKVFGTPGPAFPKDAFHERVVHGNAAAVNPARRGTKSAAWYKLTIPAGGKVVLRLRLTPPDEAASDPLGPSLDRLFDERRREADEFFNSRTPDLDPERRNVARQAFAGLLWSKQFYHYVVKDWLEGDAAQPAPPEGHKHGRNAEWPHIHARDVISMPDKWEYPWFAAWDLAFHTIPMARVDPHLAKEQLILFLREWYMHPNGQIPAYEFAMGDVNPPVHAWACWRVYKMTGPRGQRDRLFLARTFQKLMLNFTWWVNRKDPNGKNLFSGGFLGLDNIGVFDRSKPLPTGGHLEQADGTAWMAFYCGTLLSMALELASQDPAYEDVASKFFEHFVAITDAMNTLGGSGLWDEQDGFYYDQISIDGRTIPLRVRSLVGIIPILAAEVLEDTAIDRLPGFKKRMKWFLDNRKDLSRHISYMSDDGPDAQGGQGGHG
ncbi:MAG: MGH1-like glycoside hydrolase domain-containing protein, partial [Phycisphaerales bacterium]